MKIYHVETQQAYDELMIELEEKGRKWLGGVKPTQLDKFKNYGKDTYIYDESGALSFSDGYYFKAYRSNETLIEYKAKGENMTQEEEMKQKLHENALDIAVAIGVFTRGTLTVESDLQEAKSSAKKLIENIDEYLETLKPKFKVGDYVIEQNGNIISKIREVLNGDFWGSYYKKIDNYFSNSGGNILVKNIERYATPEEILEYESAFNFHNHGRKPFETKKGDLVRTPGGEITFILNPEYYKKEEFVDYGWKFLKTVEEVNEWLENK